MAVRNIFSENDFRLFVESFLTILCVEIFNYCSLKINKVGYKSQDLQKQINK